MLPIILVSPNKNQTNKFNKAFIEEHGFDERYVSIVRPLKNEITIDQIREVRRDLMIQLPSKRLIIVENFDTSSGEAQNAFLKTLEEKSEDAQFILEVGNAAKILPTILSRSKLVKLESGAKLSIRETTKKLLDTLATKNNGYIFLGDASLTGIDREDATVMLDDILAYFHRRIGIDPVSSAALLKKTMETRGLLLNNNLNPQLAIDSILISIRKEINMKKVT